MVTSPYAMPQPGMFSQPPSPPPAWGMQPPSGFNFRSDPRVTALGSALLGARGHFPTAMSSFGAMAPQAMALQQQQREQAARKKAINDWLLAKSGQKAIPPESLALLQSDPELASRFAATQLVPGDREIRNDANSIPRYVDTGEEVFKNVSTPEGMFPGKSVTAAGLNFLVGNNQLTKMQAAQIAAGKMVTAADGSMYFMRPEDLSGGHVAGAVPPGAPGASPVPTGAPPSSSGAMPAQGGTRITGPKTFGGDAETRAAGFASRMQNSNAIIDELEESGTSFVDKRLENVPLVGNYLISDEYRQLDQAKRDFVNAQLRRESGAVINPEEFVNAEKQYFPQPGDDKKTIAQKKVNRRLAIEGMERSAGPLNQSTVTPTPAAPAGPPPGVSAEEWDNMPPEDRALWK